MFEKRVQVGIVILILNTKGELLLGLRKGSHGSNTWGTTGGKLDFGEEFDDCIIRETQEETGIDLSNEKHSFLGVTNDRFKEEQKHFVSLFVLISLKKDQEAILMEQDKCIEWKWFSQDVLPTPLFSPLEKFLKHNKQKVFSSRKMAS